MVDVLHHDPREFERWMSRLSPIDRTRIAKKVHLLMYAGANLTMPNVRRLGNGLCELRVDKFRLYFTIEVDTARLLSYGSKDTQQRDIARARKRQ